MATGRHRSVATRQKGSSKRGIAGWVIPTVILVIVLIAAVAGCLWLRDRSHGDEEARAKDCIEGELILPVAEAFPGAAGEAIETYEATDPVVRDHCIRPKLAELSDAAVYVAVDSPAADQALSQAQRERATTSPAVVGSVQVGVAASPAPDVAGLQAEDVFYPGGETVDASVAAAVALSDDDAEATAALRDAGEHRDDPVPPERPVASFEAAVAPEREFAEIPGASVHLSAIPLESAGSSGEDEEIQRAAAHFAETIAESEAGATGSSDTSDAENAENQTADAAVVTPRESNLAALYRAVGVTSAPKPMDTLLLIDASAGASAIIDAAPQALAPVVDRLGQEGAATGLWNYSEPLHPGVTRPWRDNVEFGDGAEIPGVLNQLEADGEPMTRSSLVAALGKAAAHATETGRPTRVLLVTTGTAPGDLDEESFAAQFHDAVGDADVEVSVVHVGEGARDSTIDAQAARVSTTDAAGLTGAIATEAGIAV